MGVLESATFYSSPNLLGGSSAEGKNAYRFINGESREHIYFNIFTNCGVVFTNILLTILCLVATMKVRI